MAGISLAINHGLDGFRVSDFTIGTATPTGGTDMEFRFNTSDQNSNVLTKKDLLIALEAITRAIQSDAIFITPAGP